MFHSTRKHITFPNGERPNGCWTFLRERELTIIGDDGRTTQVVVYIFNEYDDDGDVMLTLTVYETTRWFDMNVGWSTDTLFIITNNHGCVLKTTETFIVRARMHNGELEKTTLFEESIDF